MYYKDLIPFFKKLERLTLSVPCTLD